MKFTMALLTALLISFSIPSSSEAQTSRDKYGNKTGTYNNGTFRNKYGQKTGTYNNGTYRNKYGQKTGTFK